jgi:hypothetical protein
MDSRFDAYGDTSAPADANDGFSNASVQGGDNRNDPATEQQLGIVRNDQGQVTNPYGNEGFFSRVLGIDPSSISYNNLLGQGTLEGIASLNVDRYNNPYASTNVLNAPVGGNQTAGTLRSGVSAGDPTRFGEVRAQRQPMTGTEMTARGLASLFGGPMMGPALMSMRDDPVAIQGSQFYDPKLDPESELYEGSGMLGSLMAPLTGGVTASDVSSNVSPMMERVRDMFSTGSDISKPNLSVDIGAAGLGVDPMKTLPAFGSEREAYGDRLSKDPAIGDQAFLDYELMSPAQMLEASKGFMNPKGSEEYDPNRRSITPTFKNPDFDRGGRTMGLEYSIPLQDLFNRVV